MSRVAVSRPVASLDWPTCSGAGLPCRYVTKLRLKESACAAAYAVLLLLAIGPGGSRLATQVLGMLVRRCRPRTDGPGEPWDSGEAGWRLLSREGLAEMPAETLVMEIARKQRVVV